jgi:hypothetical protein
MKDFKLLKDLRLLKDLKLLKNYFKTQFQTKDAHGLKIQGREYGMFLPKFLGGWGSSSFR